MPRADYDPPTAVLMVTVCDKSRCSGGAMDPCVDYYDAEGHEVSQFPDEEKRDG